jgi:hypothetical protein
MSGFKGHCVQHAHCRTCLTDPAWRRKAGAPDVCPDAGYPHFISIDNLPPIAEPPPVTEAQRKTNLVLSVCDKCVLDCHLAHASKCGRRKAIKALGPTFADDAPVGCPHRENG